MKKNKVIKRVESSLLRDIETLFGKIYNIETAIRKINERECERNVGMLEYCVKPMDKADKDDIKKSNEEDLEMDYELFKAGFEACERLLNESILYSGIVVGLTDRQIREEFNRIHKFKDSSGDDPQGKGCVNL